MLNSLKKFARQEGDSTELAFQKILILIVASTCCLCGTVWSALYVFAFGLGIIAGLPFLFTLLVGSCIIAAHVTRKHKILVYAQLACITWITAFIQWSIGGSPDNSGFVIAWSFLGPIGALIFLSLRQSIIWMLMFLFIMVITVIAQPAILGETHHVSDSMRILFYIMNVGVASVVVFSASAWFASSIQSEKKRSEKLLLNILPDTIATELKDSGKVAPRNLNNVTVIFSDFKGFTALAEGMPANELVAEIDHCFSAFDQIMSKYGIEKIKTIGDAYMAVAGGLVTQECPACSTVEAGLEMIAFMNSRSQILSEQGKTGFQMRVGVHSGNVVAGVVGLSKFQYDVWGDAVNIASRMESSGEVGKVNISQATYELIRNKFECTHRGKLPIKGKEETDMYFVKGLANH